MLVFLQFTMPPAPPPRVRRSVCNSESTCPPQGTTEVNVLTSNAACDNSHDNGDACSNFQVVQMPNVAPVVPPRVGRVSVAGWQSGSIEYLNASATSPSQVIPFSDIEQQASFASTVDVPPMLPPRAKPCDQACTPNLHTLVPSSISVNGSLMAKVPLPRSPTLPGCGYLPPVVGGVMSTPMNDICSQFDPLCTHETVQTNCENVGDHINVSDVERNVACEDTLSRSTDECQDIIYEHVKWSSTSSTSDSSMSTALQRSSFSVALPVAEQTSNRKIGEATSNDISCTTVSEVTDCSSAVGNRSIDDQYNALVPAARSTSNQSFNYIPPSSLESATSTYMDMRGRWGVKHSASMSSDTSFQRTASACSETASCRSNESSVFDLSLEQCEARRSVSSVSEESIYEGCDPSPLYQDEPIYQFYHQSTVVLDSLLQNFIGNGVEFSKIGQDAGTSGAGKDVSEAMKTVLKKTIKLQSLDKVDSSCSSEFLKTFQNLTMSCAPIQKRLWSEATRVRSSGILTTIDKQDKLLQESLFEIITSETSYVKSLDIALNHFRKSLKQSKLLSKQELSHLFSNMKAVLKVSRKFQKALEDMWMSTIMLDSVTISEIVKTLFIDNAQVYVLYSRNAVYQDRTLKELRKKSAFLNELTRLETAKEAHKQTLPSFLILPNQRVMRMPMLLEAVLSRLNSMRCAKAAIYVKDCLFEVQKTIEQSSSNGRALVIPLSLLKGWSGMIKTIAHEFLIQIAKKCDDGAREMQNLEQLHSINSKLMFQKVKTFPLIHIERMVLKTGDMTSIKFNSDHRSLMKRLSHVLQENRTLHCCLFSDILLIAKPKGDRYDVEQCVPRNCVKVAELTSAEDISSCFPSGMLPAGCQNLMSISIANDGKFKPSYVISFKQSSERLRWIEAFNHNVDEDRAYDIADCIQMQVFKPYVAQEPDELDLNDSDVVCVLRKGSEGWYEGERMRDGRRGWFPASHAVQIESVSARQRNMSSTYNLMHQFQRRDTSGVLIPRSLSNRYLSH